MLLWLFAVTAGSPKNIFLFHSFVYASRDGCGGRAIVCAVDIVISGSVDG